MCVCVKIRRLINCDVIPLLYFMVNCKQFAHANSMGKAVFVYRSQCKIYYSYSSAWSKMETWLFCYCENDAQNTNEFTYLINDHTLMIHSLCNEAVHFN